MQRPAIGEEARSAEKKLNDLIFAGSNDEEESDSTDTSLSILKRNYDIIRQKTGLPPKSGQNEFSSLNNSLGENNDEVLVRESTANRDEVEPEAGDETPGNVSFVSARSMNNITNRIDSNSNRLNRSLPLKPTSRIKIVKKQKAAAASTNQSQPQPQPQQTDSLRIRSSSPGVLRRAPDVIETIETKTSMSFIMNKSVNLVVEEKREPPPLPPRHSSVRSATTGLSPAISQPQLYQSRIDDLINTANNLIKSSNNSSRRQTNDANKTVYRSKFRINNGAFKKVGGEEEVELDFSTPIPITVQSRSKSEPKLDLHNSLSFSPKISYRVCCFRICHLDSMSDVIYNVVYVGRGITGI